MFTNYINQLRLVFLQYKQSFLGHTQTVGVVYIFFLELVTEMVKILFS